MTTKIPGHIAAALIVATAWSLSGCVWDGEPTTTHNLNIDFSLDSGENFSDKVTSVNVGLFDGQGYYICTKRIEKEQIARHAGVDFRLTPGDYRFVFWANMNGNTKIDDRGAGNAWRIVHADALFDAGRERTAGRTDPLYYAPLPADTRTGEKSAGYLPLKVGGGERHDVNVVFTHAYRSLSLYIEGLSKGDLPEVEIEGAPAGLFYSGMDRMPATMTHVQPTILAEKENKTYATATFRTFRFDDCKNIDIVIKSAANGELLHTSLAGAIAQSGWNEANVNIELVIGFIGGNVSITLPPWVKDRVDIGI